MELRKYKRAIDLPEEYKFYTVVMSDKTRYHIDGGEKYQIMTSNTNFIDLVSGDVINKAFISQILFDKEKTIAEYQKLIKANER